MILRHWIRLANSCLTRRRVNKTINYLPEMRTATAMTNLTWIQTCSTTLRKKAKTKQQPTNTKAQTTTMHPQKKRKRRRLSANGVSNVRLGLKSAKRSSRSKLKQVSQSQAGRCK